MMMTVINQKSQTKTVRCFQSHFQSQANWKRFRVKSLLISNQSEYFLTVRFSFECAIFLILLARPSYFEQCLIFQQHKTHLITRTSSKVAQKL